jgi:hypothetical protein
MDHLVEHGFHGVQHDVVVFGDGCWCILLVRVPHGGYWAGVVFMAG